MDRKGELGAKPGFLPVRVPHCLAVPLWGGAGRPEPWFPCYLLHESAVMANKTLAN